MKKFFLLFFAAMLIITGCSKGTSDWDEQYSMGLRYLSEGKYEDAIIPFSAAIQIDPKRIESYIGLTDALIGTKDFDSVKSVLQQALNSLESTEEIQKKLLELENISQETAHPSYERLKNGNSIHYEYNDEWQLTRRSVFDANGQNILSETRNYHSDGAIESIRIQETYYDTEGNLLKEIKYTTSGPESLSDQFVFSIYTDFSSSTIDFTDVNFYGLPYNELEIKKMESALAANGFTFITEDSDTSYWFQAELGEQTLPPRISALQNHGNSHVSLWNAEHRNGWGGNDPSIPIGFRDIMTQENIVSVLKKIGIINAESAITSMQKISETVFPDSDSMYEELDRCSIQVYDYIRQVRLYIHLGRSGTYVGDGPEIIWSLNPNIGDYGFVLELESLNKQSRMKMTLCFGEKRLEYANFLLH